MTDFPDAQLVAAGEVTLAIYETDGDSQRARPPLLLVHGWPEIAYSWKNQIHALAGAGFRVIALDLKGFGRSDAPHEAALYDAAHMTSDFCALLDTLDIEQAIFCGHDWGGALVWAMAQRHASRVAGVISLCTPALPRPPAPPISIIKKRFGGGHYFVQFQEPDAPEKLFETDPDRFFRLMFQKPAPRERWAALIPRVFDLPGRFRNAPALADDDLIIPLTDVEIYVDAYRRSGFHGGVNIYRNIDHNWAQMEGRDEKIYAPSLWIGAELDLFLPPESAANMNKIALDLAKHVIAGCGHWVTWEKPAEANALIIDWLTRRFST